MIQYMKELGMELKEIKEIPVPFPAQGFKECLEENKDKHENTIFYTNDPVQQSQYVNMFKAEGIDAVVLKDAIDQPFISQLEQKNENVKFVRIDAD